MERVNPPVDLNLGPEVKTTQKLLAEQSMTEEEVQVVEIPDGNRRYTMTTKTSGWTEHLKVED